MIRRLLALWRVLWGTAPETGDGYGQSLIDDVRSAARFRSLAKQSIDWLPVEAYPGDAYKDFPEIDRFGDSCFAYRRADNEDWFIVDRFWHGFPDPPEFAFLAFDQQRQIVTGYDFADWPDRWSKPNDGRDPAPSPTAVPPQ